MTDKEKADFFVNKYKGKVDDWVNDISTLRWKIVQEFNVDFHAAMCIVQKVKNIIDKDYW